MVSRVLIVDDEQDTAYIIAALVSTFDCQVRVAANGPDAIVAAREFQPDLVLLDIAMPGMDGYEVAARLRVDAGLTEAKFVALTALRRDDGQLRQAGFSDYLLKPVLRQSLQRILGKSDEGAAR